MQAGLVIKVVDPDPDYLGIEICAWNERFAGSTRVYAGLDELSKFASQIAGFPARVPDERTYEFGSRNQQFAGGYCGLCFRTTDDAGRTALYVQIEDDDQFYSDSFARFSIPVEAAAIDRFVLALRAVEAAKSGAVTLGQPSR